MGVRLGFLGGERQSVDTPSEDGTAAQKKNLILFGRLGRSTMVANPGADIPVEISEEGNHVVHLRISVIFACGWHACLHHSLLLLGICASKGVEIKNLSLEFFKILVCFR